MGDVLAAGTGVGFWVVLIALLGLLAWALYWAFGPQVLGLPAMIAVLVIVAGATSIYSNIGIGALAIILVGLAAVVVVIGMAMTVGTKRSQREADKPPTDERDG